MPNFYKFQHPDFQKDFESNTPPKAETKAALYQIRDERRCHQCGNIPSAKLQACSKCKFAVYCSRECQVTAWHEHKPKCKTPAVTDDDRGTKYPDIAMKLVTRVPACGLLLHLFQTYAIAFIPDILLSDADMLKITVTTQPADVMAWTMMLINGQDPSKNEVMLKVEKLESAPRSLNPAMALELAEAKKKAAGQLLIIPLLFTNGVQEFFHPTIVMESAMIAAAKREPIIFRTAMTGDNHIPFSKEALREAMNNFVLSDKKNQFKLRAMPPQ